MNIINNVMQGKSTQEKVLFILPFLVVVVALVIYFPSVFGEFVWDDSTYFVVNDILTKLKPSDIKEVFLYPSNYWGEHLPLRDYLYVIEYNLFGENPVGYHIVSLVIYIATAFVLLAWTRQLPISEKCEKECAEQKDITKNLSALIVFSLFLLNPIYVETVAYISGQKDILSLFFILLSLHYFYRAGVTSGKLFLLMFTIGLFFHYCAVLSKYSALATIIFVPVLWMITAKRTYTNYIKIFVLWLLANTPVILWVIYSRGVSTPFGDNTGNVTILLERIPRAINILGIHLSHFIWPWPLSFGYSFENHWSFDLYLIIGAALLLLVLVLSFMRRKSLVLLGFFIFIIYLLPVLQIYPEMANAKIFDRYLAMPLIGLFLIIERAIWVLTKGWSSRQSLAIGLLVVISLAWGFLLVKYIPTFSNTVAAMEHQYRLYPDRFTPSINFADALIYDGQLDRAELLVREEESFKEPDWLSDFLLGEIYLERGDLDKAYDFLIAAKFKTYRVGAFPFADVFLAEIMIKKGNHAMAKTLLNNLLSHKQRDPLVTYRALELLREVELAAAKK